MAIYLIAVSFGLLLLVMPVVFANGLMKFDNPGLTAYDPPPGTLLIPQRARKSYPLALLKHEDLVNPILVAALKARAKKAAHHLAIRAGQRVRTEASSENMRYAQPTSSGHSFFRSFEAH